MNESVTSTQAQDRSMDALEQSLSALPAGVRLDRMHPEFPWAQLGFAKFEPCYDDNITIDGPHRFSATFWVVGSDGRTDLALLIERWAQWGWAVDDRSGQRLGSARATSCDDYRVFARLSEGGQLSLGVSSPCFPFENLDNAHAIGRR